MLAPSNSFQAQLPLTNTHGVVETSAPYQPVSTWESTAHNSYDLTAPSESATSSNRWRTSTRNSAYGLSSLSFNSVSNATAGDKSSHTHRVSPAMNHSSKASRGEFPLENYLPSYIMSRIAHKASYKGESLLRSAMDEPSLCSSKSSRTSSTTNCSQSHSTVSDLCSVVVNTSMISHTPTDDHRLFLCGWKRFKFGALPFVRRNGDDLTSVLAVEKAVLCKYPVGFPESLALDCLTAVYATSDEIDSLNHTVHLKLDITHKMGDLLVKLSDVLRFIDKLKKVFPFINPNNHGSPTVTINNCVRWLQVNNACIPVVKQAATFLLPLEVVQNCAHLFVDSDPKTIDGFQEATPQQVELLNKICEDGEVPFLFEENVMLVPLKAVVGCKDCNVFVRHVTDLNPYKKAEYIEEELIYSHTDTGNKVSNRVLTEKQVTLTTAPGHQSQGDPVKRARIGDDPLHPQAKKKKTKEERDESIHTKQIGRDATKQPSSSPAKRKVLPSVDNSSSSPSKSKGSSSVDNLSSSPAKSKGSSSVDNCDSSSSPEKSKESTSVDSSSISPAKGKGSPSIDSFKQARGSRLYSQISVIAGNQVPTIHWTDTHGRRRSRMVNVYHLCRFVFKGTLKSVLESLLSHLGCIIVNGHNDALMLLGLDRELNGFVGYEQVLTRLTSIKKKLHSKSHQEC